MLETMPAPAEAELKWAASTGELIKYIYILICIRTHINYKYIMCVNLHYLQTVITFALHIQHAHVHVPVQAYTHYTNIYSLYTTYVHAYFSHVSLCFHLHIVYT